MGHSIEYDALWDSFKKGNQTAFSEIYRNYAALLLNYGSKISSDKTLVEDSIQDLFVELWSSRVRISRTSSIKFYLFKALRYKIVRNRKASHYEDKQFQENHTAHLKVSSYEDDFIELELQSFQMKHLRETLANLPPRQREAINLRYFHNFSNDEIARIMNITYPSACKFIYAGLKKLTENLKMSVMDILVFTCTGMVIC